MIGQHPNRTTAPTSKQPENIRSVQAHTDKSPGSDGSKVTIPPTVDRPIIFFDGDCAMCNGFVDLLLQIDSKGLFYLSPLQGETAKTYLPPLPHNREEWSIFYLETANREKAYLETAYLATDSETAQLPTQLPESPSLYSQSDAVIHICRKLGGIWSLAALGSGIPTFVRDAVYRMVARNRYRLFGQRSTCRMPSEAERSRFLP